MSVPFRKQRGSGGGRYSGGRGRGGYFHDHNKDSPGQKKDILTTMLRLVFEKSASQIYDAQGVLHLNNFRACGDLVTVQESIDFNTKNFCQALCAVIKEKVVNPQFICIDNNDVMHLHMFLDAMRQHDLHLCLNGLSAANNRIKDFDFLRSLRQFSNLQEVKFVGNPISEKPEYLKVMRKSLPSILGVDGVGIHRPPLSLPFPMASQHSQEATNLLVQIDQNLFQAVAHGGIDSAISFYHTNAVLTLTIEENFHMICKSSTKDKKVEKDLAHMKMRQLDHNRNLALLQHLTRCSIGRTKVCAALADTLYPRTMQVLHELNPSADIQMLSTGVKYPMAIITFHGIMIWKHELQDVNDKNLNKACFDRTMTLINEGKWQITNEVVHLRRHRGDALLMPASPTRVESVSRKFKIDPSIVIAATEMSSNDSELFTILTDLQPVPAEILAACVQGAGSPQAGIPVARVVSHFKIQPSSAAAALQAANNDLNTVEAVVRAQFSGPEHQIR